MTGFGIAEVVLGVLGIGSCIAALATALASKQEESFDDNAPVFVGSDGFFMLVDDPYWTTP